MNLKKIIISANTKLENKFNSLSKISLNMLIFGQLFFVLILCSNLFYAVCLNIESRILQNIFMSIQLVFENAASGLFLLWLGAIFIDYIDKKNN